MDAEFSNSSTTSAAHVENETRKGTSGEGKKGAIQEELKRMQQLPASSSYAIHRRRVLNKILHLMAMPRSASEDEELELLFAQLSL